jgi:hypothetical protein
LFIAINTVEYDDQDKAIDKDEGNTAKWTDSEGSHREYLGCLVVNYFMTNHPQT